MRAVKKFLKKPSLSALTTRRAPSSIVRTPLPGFDPIYYLYWYPDVRVFPQGPLVHYIHYGWREGRDPSAGFSGEGYLKANPDVRESGCNPLVHFVECGLAEGRKGWQKNPDAPPPKPHPMGYQSGKLLPPPTRPAGS
ncbi:hypothetical protein M2440_001964 [Methylorubrum extorquens]|uniref:hypothetical protein n=1 Tax=Methylorubrum extorquens TaxID=408 RepID=UPI00209E51CC|nr:hypothetical protein [Methylorubrum extorquens]MDF9791263.1 hypothetical protein [Methylorubrum extorquens]MDF9862965.1 hypothetical protein [Methylorubrum pseudosasae]MDH6665755.1 hypothetical protein [Methylorubrum zatmanii]